MSTCPRTADAPRPSRGTGGRHTETRPGDPQPRAELPAADTELPAAATATSTAAPAADPELPAAATAERPDVVHRTAAAGQPDRAAGQHPADPGEPDGDDQTSGRRVEESRTRPTRCEVFGVRACSCKQNTEGHHFIKYCRFRKEKEMFYLMMLPIHFI